MDVTLFKQIKNPKEIQLKYNNSKLPPKHLLFCQTETLFKFTPGTKGKIQSPEIDNGKKAVFGISQLPPDEGVPLLIELAQTHSHPKVRKQAMFWLGQSGDQRALDFFERILLGR